VRASLDVDKGDEQMTLTKAFSIVTGTIQDASGEDRDQAMATIYNELHRLAKRLRVDRDIQEESASYGFQRLVLGGPREVQSLDPVVQAYLWRIVASVSHDLARKRGREAPMASEDALATPNEKQIVRTDPETQLLEAETQREQQSRARWVRHYVFSEVAKAVAEAISPRYRQDFVEAMSHFERLLDGQVTFDGLVDATFGEITTATRDRLYQRHCRARRRLFEWAESQLPQSGLLPEQMQLVCTFIAQFRR